MIASIEQVCDNESEVGQRWRANRPLTHPLDYGEEGLAVHATRSAKTCEYCGRSFTKKPKDPWALFDQRRFCTRTCGFAHRAENQVPLTERLWAKIAVAGPDDCWLWQNAATDNGYGVIGRGGGRGAGNILAHVAVYLDKVGPIPDGWQVDHLCRQTLCCNPAHLEAVTQAENLRRQAAAIAAARTSCGKGIHPWPEHLAVGTSGQRYCRACNQANSRAAYLRRKAGL